MRVSMVVRVRWYGACTHLVQARLKLGQHVRLGRGVGVSWCCRERWHLLSVHAVVETQVATGSTEAID